jgi:TolB-like protein
MATWLLLSALLTIQPYPPLAVLSDGLPSAEPRKVVAVLAFDNASGQPRYDPLGRGIAAMMMTDLSHVAGVQLVERDRLQDVLAELQLQQSHHVDPATAQRVGRIAGAEYIVTGALSALQPRMRIDTRVVRVETGEIVKTASVTGNEDRFFELQDRLANELIDGLEIALSPEQLELFRQQQEANRITRAETMLTYSEALVLFDQEEYVDAAQKMYVVMQAAPQSVLVRVTYEMMRDRAARQAERRARSRIGRFLREQIP